MFSELVILDMDPANAGLLERKDRTSDIRGIVPAVLSVGNHRDIDGVGNPVRVRHHFRHRNQTDVGHAEAGRRG
jgi:hypothetical protein